MSTTFSPQQTLFATVNKVDSINKTIFWCILFLSIAPVLFKNYLQNKVVINGINIMNIIGIALFFILDIVNEYILAPQAERKRRDDFIDNSFGSKFLPENSREYFDNDDIDVGLYKAAINLFQNCFFTKSLTQSLSTKKVIIPAVGFVLIIIFGYNGFKEVPFALSVLQAILSANILGALIKHLILLNRLEAIYEDWVSLFQTKDLKKSIIEFQPFIYRYWLQYEILVNKIRIDVSERVYQKLNPQLTQEWNRIKLNYNIS